VVVVVVVFVVVVVVVVVVVLVDVVVVLVDVVVGMNDFISFSWCGGGCHRGGTEFRKEAAVNTLQNKMEDL